MFNMTEKQQVNLEKNEKTDGHQILKLDMTLIWLEAVVKWIYCHLQNIPSILQGPGDRRSALWMNVGV